MSTFEIADARGRTRRIPVTKLRFLRGFSGSLRELGLERLRRALQRRVARPSDRGAAERVSKLLDSVRLCPECGYDLEGLAPEADGCTICPECGAAWKTGAGNFEA